MSIDEALQHIASQLVIVIVSSKANCIAIPKYCTIT